MGFKILDSKGDAILINDLDKEAGIFWHGESFVPDKCSYLSPDKEGFSLNWFDSIGFQIHSPKSNWTSGWDNVKCSLMAVQTMQFGMLPIANSLIKLHHAYEFLKPYFDLVEHWKAKGYTPVQTSS